MKTKLSICIATFNRASLLPRLFASLGTEQLHEVELVIVDDGSTDDSRSVIRDFADQTDATVTYLWQENAGRATALQKAIMAASAPYCVIMDSDDYFVPGGLACILAELPRIPLDPAVDDRLCGIVFGVVLARDSQQTINLPPETPRTNFTAIRADFGISGDLKEVVRTDVMRRHIYSIPAGCRRVPTSLLWSSIAEEYDCLCVGHAVAVKEYLPGGMTQRILTLKTRNAAPMVTLYRLLSNSRAYRSKWFRIKCRALAIRYAFHAGLPRLTRLSDLFFLPLAGVLYLSDKARLALRQRKRAA